MPELYKFRTSKIKNKNLKRALKSDITNYVVKEAKKKLLRTYLVKEKMSKGLSNFQIEKILKDIGDPDINDNFVSVFPTNYLDRFIDYKTMISEKKEISIYHSKH